MGELLLIDGGGSNRFIEEFHLEQCGINRLLLDLVLPGVVGALSRGRLQFRCSGGAAAHGRNPRTGACRAASSTAQPDQSAFPVQQPELALCADSRREEGT